MTVAKALESISITKLSKRLGKANIVKAIVYLLLRLSENFNVGQKFSNEQAAIVANDLFDVFGYETLDDVLMMLKLARQGQIGQGHDYKLDGQTVMRKWIPDYLALKAQERENRHNKRKGELNGMNGFKWDKQDVEKLKVSEKLSLPTKLGERMRAKYGTEESPQIILKDRKDYVREMSLQVMKMSVAQLKEYLVKVDVHNEGKPDSIPYDETIYKLVEKVLDAKMAKSKA